MKKFKIYFLPFAVITVIYILLLHSRVGIRRIAGDDVRYILLSESIVKGYGYSDIFLPQPLPHPTFPPVVPLLMAPVILFLGRNILLIKLIFFIFTLSTLYLLYFIFRQMLSLKETLLLIYVFALHLITAFMATEVMSESIYLPFSLLNIIFVERAAKGKSLYLWLVILFTVICFYTRSVGIIFLPAISLYFLFHKRYTRSIIFLSICSIFVSLWFIRMQSLHSEGYFSGLFAKDITLDNSPRATVADLLKRVGYNSIIYCGKVMADVFFYPHFDNITKDSSLFVLKFAISMVLTLFIILGYFFSVRKYFHFLHIYVLIFVIVCILWPFNHSRLVYPIFPFLLLYVVNCIKNWNYKNLYVGFCIILLVNNLYADIVEIYKLKTKSDVEEDMQSYIEALDWIKDNTRKTDIVMSLRASFVYFYTGRRGIGYFCLLDREKIYRLIVQNGINYIIVDSLGYKYEKYGLWKTKKFLIPVIEEYKSSFEEVYRTKAQPYTYVYKVKYDNN